MYENIKRNRKIENKKNVKFVKRKRKIGPSVVRTGDLEENLLQPMP